MVQNKEDMEDSKTKPIIIEGITTYIRDNVLVMFNPVDYSLSSKWVSIELTDLQIEAIKELI